MERGRRQFLRLLFIFPFVFLSLLSPYLFSTKSPSPSSPPLIIPSSQNPPRKTAKTSITCDRSAFSTDVCHLQGDVRTDPSSSSIHLLSHPSQTLIHEKIKPYSRKWETYIMNSIAELNLKTLDSPTAKTCDVTHISPALVFSTGGYTGNVFHDFRDVIVPLFISAVRFNREVIFLIVDYRPRWLTKYHEILSTLSAYPPIDFFNDKRIHCFDDVTVGLHIHEDLAVDPSLTIPLNKTIDDFRKILEQAFLPSLPSFNLKENKKWKLVFISRKGSRSVENENDLVKLCEELGFWVEVLRPDSNMKLAEIYGVLNPSDVMIGVVGCALTHLLFMRPGAVFIQVKPLGTEWAGEINYGNPAKKAGLKYIPYTIRPEESSLSRVYEKDDPVLVDPESVASKGWEVTKKVFMSKQTVRLDLRRFNESLSVAYQYLVERNKGSKSEM